MAKAEKNASEIVRAAQTLEDEIVLLETISKSARKIRLNSGKNIARAAAELNETLALPERLAQRLQEVAAALTSMQQRQQAALEPLTAFAVEIQRRTQRLGEHMQSFDALGKAAGEINGQLAASQGDRAVVARAEARLQEISDAARTLFEAARGDDFPEIAREADVLKQRMAALRKRLSPTA
jgi:DNA repair exonuclease SbcCD ATPase subunit